AQTDAGGQDRQIRRAELHAQRAAVPDLDGEVESTVLDAQFVEVAQCATGEVPQLGIVALGLELRDDDDRQDYRMLREAEECLRVAEQHGCVEHICAKSRVIV